MIARFMIECVLVEVTRAGGAIGGDGVCLIDCTDPDSNEWPAVNHVAVIENNANHCPSL